MMSKRLSLSILALFASLLLLAAAAPAAEAPAEAAEATAVEVVPTDAGAVEPVAAPWLANALAFDDLLAPANRCSPPTCAIDFGCFLGCEAGPEDEFCSCLQGCILFCA